MHPKWICALPTPWPWLTEYNDTCAAYFCQYIVISVLPEATLKKRMGMLIDKLKTPDDVYYFLHKTSGGLKEILKMITWG